jgi:hypothetical protein
MSVNKRRTHAQRLRAEAARQRSEANLIEHITRSEKIKKLTPESKQRKPPDAPAKESPYMRLLRRIDEENARQQK